MKEMNCKIIRDLLPLYADEVVCADTKELVDQHLEGCPDCRKELELLQKTVTIPLENETKPLKQFQKKWKQIRFRTSLISIFCTVVILAAIVAGALWYTRPISAEELCPGLDWSDPTDFSASYQVREVHPNGKVDTSFQSLNLEPDDPAIDEFIALLKSQTLHQKLSNLLPAADPDHLDWVACIVFPENTSLLLTCSGSTLTLQYQDQLIRCKAGNAFNQAVLDLFQLQNSL